MFSVDELHQPIRSHSFEFLELRGVRSDPRTRRCRRWVKTQSPLSKPHVRFSREQTLVAPAKLVAFYSQMDERRAGCAKPSTELFRGRIFWGGGVWGDQVSESCGPGGD